MVLGLTLSPSMPGDRFLKFSSQRRPPDRNLGNIVWYDALSFDSGNMSSPKRHVLISLPFILKYFSKPFVSRNLSFLRRKDSHLLVMLRVRGRMCVKNEQIHVLVAS